MRLALKNVKLTYTVLSVGNHPLVPILVLPTDDCQQMFITILFDAFEKLFCYNFLITCSLALGAFSYND